MSEAAYAQALDAFARCRAPSRGSWDAMLASLCPEFLEAPPKELIQCTEPAAVSLFSSLIFQIGQELHELVGGVEQKVQARKQEDGYMYQVGALPHFTNARGLIELWRFGIALDVRDPQLAQDVQEVALLSLKKDVQGAWRVAIRRWKSYSKSQGKLHPAGDALRAQARRVESALSIVLSDPTRLCSRADLATDWLGGVDLWLHRPGAAAHKGEALALSLLKSKQVEAKKLDAVSPNALMWTPNRLAARLVQDLRAASAEPALAFWASLGKPADTQQLEQRLRASMLELATLRRGIHPSAHASTLVGWLRHLR